MRSLQDWASRKPIAAGAILLAGLMVCILLDPFVLRHVHAPRWEESDFYHLLRDAGYLPTWIAFAAAIFLVNRREGDARLGGWRPPAVLLGAAMLSGLGAVVLKILVRRLRPLETGDFADPAFRPWSENFFNGGGLSFPSEHAAVAFPACFVLCRLFPRAWPIWFAWAVGCAATRLTQRAHFLSDVYGSMLLGLIACELLWRWVGPKAGTDSGLAPRS